MRRSPGWIIVMTLGILLSLVGPAATPASAHLAEPLPQTAAPSATTATPDDEIIVLESSGRIRVDDPYHPATIKSADWNSGSDANWTNIVTGDFDGDAGHDAEIAATRGTELKIFDPFPTSRVLYDGYAPYGGSFRLMAAGDFNGDGKDELAVTFTRADYSGEYVWIYYGGANGTSWSSVPLTSPDGYFGAEWQDIAAGHIDSDVYDDIALVRKNDNLLKVYFGPDLHAFGDYLASYPWLTVAIGNISVSTLPDTREELAISREGIQAVLDSMILFHVSGATFADVSTGVNLKFNPPFTSLAMCDVNGDGDDEIMALRDPKANTTSLLMINPSNPSGVGEPPSFERSTGYSGDGGGGAFRFVACGDLDADGRDETVILRGDKYRTYDDALAGYTQSADNYSGPFYWYNSAANAKSLMVANVDGAGVSAGPVLAVSADSVDLEGEWGQYPSVALDITNSGNTDSVSWSAEVSTVNDSRKWLTVNGGSTASGSTPGRLIVTLNTRAADIGEKTSSITISASDGSSWTDSKTISVSAAVTDPGFLVTPSSVGFLLKSGQAASRDVTLEVPSSTSTPWTAALLSSDTASAMIDKLGMGEASITGQGIVSADGTILAVPTWASINPDHGTAPTNGKITISANATGPATAHHHAILVVIANPSSPDRIIQTVDVLLGVSDSVNSVYLPRLFK